MQTTRRSRRISTEKRNEKKNVQRNENATSPSSHFARFAFAISLNDNGIQLKAANHFSIKLNKSKRKQRDAFNFPRGCYFRAMTSADIRFASVRDTCCIKLARFAVSFKCKQAKKKTSSNNFCIHWRWISQNAPLYAHAMQIKQ